MHDEQANKARRKLLKTIAAGGGVVVAGKSLPDSWTRPVVDSVMLPAHAQTSPGSGTGGGTGGGGTGSCLVTGDYCAGQGTGAGAGSMVIRVSADGTIAVFIGNQVPGTDSIDPTTGGSFAVVINSGAGSGSGGGTITVTGTVVCGSTTISGTETDSDGTRSYTATPC
jgi:hypothetical protein